MAQVHLHIPSFNAGELSPLLGARFGVEKVQAGCRRLRNFIIHPHGPAFRRPGLEYRGASMGAGAKSSLRGFNFSTTTGAVLEFHPSGLQVWQDGEVRELANAVPLPYSENECAEVQMAQVNDVCYLTHPNHRPQRLVRYPDDDWRLEDIAWKWPPLGDENVRLEEIAKPTSTDLGGRPTMEWPEFTMPAHAAITWSAVDTQLSSETKVARLKRWVGVQEDYPDGWFQMAVRVWTDELPTPYTLPGGLGAEAVMRIEYKGPVLPVDTGTPNRLLIEWAGPTPGSADLPLDRAQPENLVPIEVPAGDWQVTLTAPATVPPHTSLYVQRVEGLTRTNLKILKPVAGQTVTWRGRKFGGPATILLNWLGRAMPTGTAHAFSLQFPTVAEITVSVSDTTGKGKTMAASSAIFQRGHVGSFWQIAHRRDSAWVEIVRGPTSGTPPSWSFGPATSDSIRVAGKWELFTYGTWTATLFLEKKIGATWEVVRSWSGRADRNVVANGDEDEEVEMRIRVSNGTGKDASGVAAPRFIFEASDARVYGLVQIKEVIAASDTEKVATAKVDILTTLHATTPTSLWTEDAWSGVKGYPRSVVLHGGRLWFGGTRAEPQRLWGSVVNDYENFRRSSLDDASVSFTPAAQQANAIQWMTSHGSDLVLGTAGDEWTVSAENGGIVTPSNVYVQRRSSYGSQFLPALLLGDVIVFVQRGGQKLRQVAPRSDLAVWSAADVTVLAEHVARAGVKQVAAMNFPSPILWAVTGDGKLLGMTFEQEQNVFGWHVHETDGFVESVAVIYGTESDEVWLAVSRNGRRNIERLDGAVFARKFQEPEKLIYLDGAVKFESVNPISLVTGLSHLEGCEVSVLGDGAQLASVRVTSGTAAVEAPSRIVVVGLPFTSELQPMRMEIPLQDGTAQHRRWRMSRVGLLLHESLGGEIADGPEGRFEALQFRHVSTPMGEAPPLFSGEMETAIESRAREGADVIIRQRAPLPLNVAAITLKGDVYGE